MRLLLAARLSQDHSGQTGLDTQDADARAWAERNGHEVIGTAADKISGRVSPFDRPNLGPWLSDPMRMRLYDGLILSKIDRLSRGRDWNIRAWAEQHGKKILVVQPELCWPPAAGDTATPIVWDVLVNISSAEWENTSTRYRRMQQHLRSSGALVGRPPFGYRITGEANAKTLEPDPDQAAAVQAVAAMYLSGQPLRELCTWLDEQGIRPRTIDHWTRSSLGKLFRNETLTGRRKDASGRTLLRVAPILDRETWEQLQAELDRKARRRGGPPRDTALLTGIVVCHRCSGPMYRQVHKKEENRSYPYYRCFGPSGTGTKCRNMWPLPELEARLDKYMVTTLARWPRYETVVIRGHDHAAEIAEVETDLRELDFDDPEFAANQQALLAERNRLRGLGTTPDVVRRERAGDTIGGHWQTLTTDADRRAFLLRLGMTIRAARAKTRADDVVLFEIFGRSVKIDEFVADPDWVDSADDDLEDEATV
ncbi:MAG TPA: recombinase family protein [Streptosporangiaceae bacterium]|nr:recombinase family protein [Streptosporangiaceae bacterium]